MPALLFKNTFIDVAVNVKSSNVCIGLHVDNNHFRYIKVTNDIYRVLICVYEHEHELRIYRNYQHLYIETCHVCKFDTKEIIMTRTFIVSF